MVQVVFFWMSAILMTVWLGFLTYMFFYELWLFIKELREYVKKYGWGRRVIKPQ